MEMENEAVLTVARLMAMAARTAPKAKGTDALIIKVVSGTDLLALADEVRRYGEAHDTGFFIRDADNIAASDACLIIGCERESVLGLNCGGCGYKTCDAMLAACTVEQGGQSPFFGPNCVMRMADIGIALGSAVKTAAIHSVDNRIMYSAGVGALRLGWLADASVAYGIPLKCSGKNIYFDRQK
jgi:uncharacterized ferredoxin-like protein